MAYKSTSKRTFKGFAKGFCKAFSCDFDGLRVALARKSMGNESCERELFDDIEKSPPQIDRKALNDLIVILGQNTKYMDNPPEAFLDDFEEFIDKKVRYYSFRDQDIAKMQEVLQDDYTNPKIRERFEQIAERVEKVHKQKRNRKLTELNKWAFGYKNEDLIKKLSFRSTYVNILYESIVRQNDIKDISIEDYYHQHRLKVQQRITALTGTTDTKGKVIVRKYAGNKVYKTISAQDKFKLQACRNALVNYQDESFYDDTASMLTALDGGEKNRDLKKPLRSYHYDR